MRGRHVAAVLILAVAAPGGALAQSGPLTIVTVDAKELPCTYDKGCKAPMTDSTATIEMSNTIGHLPQPRLHTRTVPGVAGAPAAGKTGYLYRLDMTNAVGSMSVPCVTALTLDVGPTVKFEYFKGGANADVFVIDKGGAGTVGLSKAERAGNGITFTFRKPVCTGSGPGGGESSLLFGVTSDRPPRASTAQLQIVEGTARAPSAAKGKAPARTPAY